MEWKTEVKAEDFLELWSQARERWLHHPDRIAGTPLAVVMSMPLVQPSCFFLFDRSLNQTVYFSPGYQELMGTPAPAPEHGYPHMVSLRHPDDRQRHFDFVRKLYDYFREMTVEEALNGCFTSVLRMQTANGYRWMTHREIVLECDSQSVPIISMVHLSPCPDPQPDRWSGSLTVFGQARLSVSAPHPVQQLTPNPLSPQERRVLALLAQGFSSKMIAAELNLSVLTINTHRRNMLQKTGCANTAELISLCR